LVPEEGNAKITGPGTLSLSLKGENADKVALIRLEKGASIVFDPLTLMAGGYDAIRADEDGTIIFYDTDPVTIEGNISGGDNLMLAFVVKPDTILNWPTGKLKLIDGAKVNMTFEIDGMEAYNTAHPDPKVISLGADRSPEDKSATNYWPNGREW
jgi:hypothetical protein